MNSNAKAAAFRELHKPGEPFVIPNPWDAGSARIMEGLGFKALATTSSGFAMTLGRKDYGVTKDEALTHGAVIADAVDIPVSADLENGFGLKPEDAADTIARACETGLTGGSIEDSTGDKQSPVIEDEGLAVARIEAAVGAAKNSGRDFVLTGVPKPVNILILGKLAEHAVAEFADAGAARLSIGGGLAWNAYGTLGAATEMLNEGRFDMLSANPDGAKKIASFLKA